MIDPDYRLHYQFIHAFVRKMNDPADAERARTVHQWASNHGADIQKFMDPDEFRLFLVLWDHWRKHNQAADITTVRELLLLQNQSEGPLRHLDAYVDHAKGFKENVDSIAAQSLLSRCLDDRRDVLFNSVVTQARQIALGGLLMEEGREKKQLQGIEDARTFLLEKLQSDAFHNGRINTGGTFTKIADDLPRVYRQNKEWNKGNKRVIPTGVRQLDCVIDGLERGSFNLILGAAGQRKSGMARTIAYNAAATGFRVLFLPLEFRYEEELQIFAAMHCANENFLDGGHNFTIQRITHTELSQAEERALETVVVPSLEHDIGDRLSIIRPAEVTWENIANIVETENYKEPLDLIVMDYFARMDTRKYKDKVAAINDFAIRAKDFFLDLKNPNGGCAFLSPAHASRAGIKLASENDGNYNKEAVWQYSELEKSADMILFTYQDPGLQSVDQIKVGTCKSRRTQDVAAQIVPVNLRFTQYFGPLALLV